MDPKPDYGLDSYKGSGKLKNKVSNGPEAYAIMPGWYTAYRCGYAVQVALITGADSGIGRAIALAFAREGANVAISYWNEDKDADETKKAVEDAGQQAILLPGDLTKEAQCK